MNKTENIDSEVYTEPRPVSEVGELVEPIERPMGEMTHWLRSGCGQYPHAVVVQLEPTLILVSVETDMMWCTNLDINNYQAIGTVPQTVLNNCKRRLNT